MTGNEAGIDVQEEAGEWDLFKASNDQLLIMPKLQFLLC